MRYGRAGRVGQAHQTHQLEVEIVLGTGPLVAVKDGPGHSQHAEPTLGHGIGCGTQLLHPALVEMAEVGYGLGGAFRGYYKCVSLGRAPHVRHGQKVRGKGVLVHQLPVCVEVLRALEVTFSQVCESPLHGIEGVHLAGQDPVFHQLMERLVLRGVKTGW